MRSVPHFSLQPGFFVVKSVPTLSSIAGGEECKKAEILLLETSVFSEKDCAAINLLRQNFGIRPVIIHAKLSASEVRELMDKGIRGFVSSASGIETLGEALKKVHTGGHYFDPAISTAIATGLKKNSDLNIEGEGGGGLNRMEFEVLIGISRGESVASIACALNLSKRTVERYRSRLFKKFSVKSETGLLISAIRSGVLPLSRLL